jgi:hypothetical protein
MCVWSLLEIVWHSVLIILLEKYVVIDQEYLRKMIRISWDAAQVILWYRVFTYYFAFRIIRPILLVLSCSHGNDEERQHEYIHN